MLKITRLKMIIPGSIFAIVFAGSAAATTDTATDTAAAASTLASADIGALGKDTKRCNESGLAVPVKVYGFKSYSGNLRVQIYPAHQNIFLEKRQWLERIDLPVTNKGPMHVCVPVTEPGRYVVSVRHDLNGNGKNDRYDGGGLSGNPDMKLTDFLFSRKPELSQVAFTFAAPSDRSPEASLEVSPEIPIVLNYLKGLSFKPVK